MKKINFVKRVRHGKTHFIISCIDISAKSPQFEIFVNDERDMRTLEHIIIDNEEDALFFYNKYIKSYEKKRKRRVKNG